MLTCAVLQEGVQVTLASDLLVLAETKGSLPYYAAVLLLITIAFKPYYTLLSVRVTAHCI